MDLTIPGTCCRSSSGRVRCAITLLLPCNPMYLPIADYCRIPIFTTETHVEALTLSLACTGELGTLGESLGGRYIRPADLLLHQVHSWLDYNPGARQKLEPKVDKLQSFTCGVTWRTSRTASERTVSGNGAPYSFGKVPRCCRIASAATVKSPRLSLTEKAALKAPEAAYCRLTSA